MADVSAPEIREAYEDVRNDKTETNWLLLDYASAREDRLVLTGTGNGGLTEFKQNLQEENASFGYIRVKYANDTESTREKFIFVVWIGSGVKVMRKAKLSVHSADVKKVLSQFSIEVPANSIEDLNEDPIVVRLRKAGGASYDRA
ncbi:coactosin family protein [Sporobolomyces salmoneus]|uniref:coactosin family protein n=1 Tax=Sporobolomyces salmoneus TaxID=183962 RepID=UPI0031772104